MKQLHLYMILNLFFIVECSPNQTAHYFDRSISDGAQGTSRVKKGKKRRASRATVTCDPDMIGCDSGAQYDMNSEEEVVWSDSWNQRDLKTLIEKDPNAEGKTFIGQRVFGLYRTFIRLSQLIVDESLSIYQIPFVIAQPNPLDTITSDSAAKLYDFVLIGHGFVNYPSDSLRPNLFEADTPTLTVSLNGRSAHSMAMMPPEGYEPIYYNPSLIMKRYMDCFTGEAGIPYTQGFCDEFSAEGRLRIAFEEMMSMDIAFHKPIPRDGWKCIGHIASNGKEPLLDCQSRRMDHMIECFGTMNAGREAAEAIGSAYTSEAARNNFIKTTRMASNCIAEQYVAPGKLGKELVHIKEMYLQYNECTERYGEARWKSGSCESKNKVMIRQLISADDSGLEDPTNFFIAIPEARWPELYNKIKDSNDSAEFFELSDEEREQVGAWVFKKDSIYMLGNAKDPRDL